jgi:hypothetical protein
LSKLYVNTCYQSQKLIISILFTDWLNIVCLLHIFVQKYKMANIFKLGIFPYLGRNKIMTPQRFKFKPNQIAWQYNVLPLTCCRRILKKPTYNNNNKITTTLYLTHMKPCLINLNTFCWFSKSWKVYDTVNSVFHLKKFIRNINFFSFAEYVFLKFFWFRTHFRTKCLFFINQKLQQVVFIYNR